MRCVLQSTSGESPRPIWVLLLAGFMSTVISMWGVETVTCDGIFAGAMSSLLKLTLHVFALPEVGLAALLVWIAGSGLAFGLSRLGLFRQRVELLLFLIPVAAYFAGVLVAKSGYLKAACALAPLH